MSSPRSEALEADTRRLMAEHARIVPRGFDTIRQRAELHRRIDHLLDELAVEGELEELDAL